MMRLVLFTLVVSVLVGTAAVRAQTTWYVDDVNDGQTGSGTVADPFRDLQYALDVAGDGDTVIVQPGQYVATPAAFVDRICGNCSADQVRQDIPATRGFRVAGKALTILGVSRSETILTTRAGYGVLFEGAGNSMLANLTVTGGVRDDDDRATDGAIVARHTTLTVRDVDVANNSNLGPRVVGIIGIAGREGSVLVVENTRIENNSWDGIALYRSDPAIPGSAPRATIRNVVIKTGRGAGIGVTWDAQANIAGATVSNYWNGVSVFATSRVSLTNSIVRDTLGWGLIVSGQAHVEAINNVFVRNGNTGFSAWNEGVTATFTNNIVTGNGWFSNEWVAKRSGVWLNATSGVTLSYNDVWGNQGENVCRGGIRNGAPCEAVPFVGSSGNISDDPLYVDDASGNGALRCGSPAIDAGSPGILDRDGTRSDMGVYGGPGSSPSPPPCGLADLIPTRIFYQASPIVPGQVVFFDSGVQNLTRTGTGFFNIRWFVDDVSAGYGSHVGVPGNSTILNGNSAFRWTATAGTHRIRFSVDVDNFVSELNEENNSREVTVVVQ